MPIAYSDDLRRKLLEARQRGEGSFPRLAARFGVSVAWAGKITAQLARTGKMEREPGRKRGPASKITPALEQDLKDWIVEQPDLTLSELQHRLNQDRQVQISVSRLWTVLKGIGMRFKKSRSMPPNRIRSPFKTREASGAMKYRSSTPKS
jgi:transposase